MLKTDIIWPDSRRFKSRSLWEPIGFFSDGLCNATEFDLKLGFFSSSAISVLCDGFAYFLYNGGRMRLIINDVLSEPDKTSVSRGMSRDILTAFDLHDIKGLKSTLSSRDTHFFECLAWLIRNKRIDLKIITPRGRNGIAHTKCGIFSDGRDKVAFDGSCNFSRAALIENCESISAFCSWDGEADTFKIKDIEEDFDLTFLERDETVDYLSPQDIRTCIADSFDNKDIKQLLEQERDINSQSEQMETLSPTIKDILGRAREHTLSALKQLENANDDTPTDSQERPHFPYPEGPREYQRQAFQNWKGSQCGLFAMATGTGKTLTALNCLLEIFKKWGYYKAVILVPTLTLVEQWEAECQKFNFRHVYKVSSKEKNWRSDLSTLQLRENHNPNLSYIVISTYASFARSEVSTAINALSHKNMLIADEAHNMGGGRLLERLGNINFKRRIGLSATPDRQYDELGDSKVKEFFGVQDKYTFEYPMAKAIENGFLCRYYYYPHLVSLTDEEQEEYMKISRQLVKFYDFGRNSFSGNDGILTALLLKRKRIVHKAVGKESAFRDIVAELYRKRGNLRYTLVYAPEGDKADGVANDFSATETIEDDQDELNLIRRYTQIVKEVSPTTTVRMFTSDAKERSKILASFAMGELEVLTSMKCLGVDIPRSETAIFCASTGNPRQFIQRRGRILRTHTDKRNAVIHDLVVAPQVGSDTESYKMERNLLNAELRRVRDFARLSENADFAYAALEDIADYYKLSIL